MTLLAKLFGSIAKRNRALDFIAKSYPRHPKAQHLINVLPDLASTLYAEAEQSAGKMLQQNEAERRPDHRRLLTECILDLELVRGFDEVVEYTNDSKLSSCYVDAVVYQATGKESSVEPTERQYRVEGTHMCRGIAKYSRAKQYFKISDAIAWLFGKEYSAILSGSPTDIAYILPVLPLTVLIRAEGAWRTRYVLTGNSPTNDEQSAVSAMVDEMMSERDRLFQMATAQAGEATR